MTVRNRTGLAIVCVFLVLLVLCVAIWTLRSSFDINPNEVYAISIMSREPEYCSTEIYSRDGIDEAIRVLNSIKISRISEETYLNELPGDSPDAIVYFHDAQGSEDGDIYFYGEVLSANLGLFAGGTYRIDISEYEKIDELCRKYGK